MVLCAFLFAVLVYRTVLVTFSVLFFSETVLDSLISKMSSFVQSLSFPIWVVISSSNGGSFLSSCSLCLSFFCVHYFSS